jgi:uncharacterized protein YyaL (SSP411 family)
MEGRGTFVGSDPSKDADLLRNRDPAKDASMLPQSAPARCIGLLIALLSSLLHAPKTSADPPGENRPANRLAKETSPYLLQHAHNPVDWFPWGPEAFAKAKAENKPIFLSIGYSSCYWCHVMERESFEDAEIARFLNQHLVCIKVDREERPDVDQIYMSALQAIAQGGGGWPMSMFLTPDGRPFFGVTYLPPRDRDGATGFLGLINAIAKAWDRQRPEIEKSADALTDAVRQRLRTEKGRAGAPLSRELASRGLGELTEQFDAVHGGFGFNPRNPRRPKFPEPANLVFVLDQHIRGVATRKTGAATAKPEGGPAEPLEMVRVTLDHMARGGIRDHLAGGYHRYSTDRFWAVPHFEKMLYDNAQLSSVHLSAFEITGDPRWRAEAEATFAFVERSMTAPEGGFYSSLDAETKAGEGAYYVWSRGEVKAALGDGPDGDAFAQVYGLTGEPNFEGGRYVLQEPRSRAEQATALKTTPAELEARLGPFRARLLAVREKRPAPRLDDKVLTGWNGLMIAAYADGYRVLKIDKYRRAGEAAADFLLRRLRASDGRLLRTYRAGQAKLGAYVEDYAFLAHGLLRLHAATADARWLGEARALVDRMIADFEDREDGGFFFTAEGHESLLARPKDPLDNALPSGNSMAVLNLLALHKVTGDSSYLDHAGKALRAFATPMTRLPYAMPVMLVGLEQFLDSDRASARAASGVPVADMKDDAPKIVTASARLAEGSAASVARGAEIDAVVRVSVDPGWHIYANPASSAELRPTTLALAASSATTATVAAVKYPAGELKTLASNGPEKVAVYEGKFEIAVRFRLAEQVKPGISRVMLRLSYQACNDKVCLAPASLEIPLDLNVAR